MLGQAFSFLFTNYRDLSKEMVAQQEKDKKQHDIAVLSLQKARHDLEHASDKVGGFS